MGGWMSGWMSECIYWRPDGWMDRLVGEKFVRSFYEMKRWLDGWIDGWEDGWNGNGHTMGDILP